MRIFDFDGTLVDLWPRYHAVFCELVGKNISFDLYKSIKKKYKRDEEVARVLNISLPEKYFSKKETLLEDIDFLKLDKLYFKGEEWKNIMGKNHIILTKRRSRENFEWELDYLGVESRFELITSGKKEDWVRDNVSVPAVVVGDSVEELKIGNLSGITVYMVEYGLGTKNEFDKMGVKFNYYRTAAELADSLRKIKEIC